MICVLNLKLLYAQYLNHVGRVGNTKWHFCGRQEIPVVGGVIGAVVVEVEVQSGLFEDGEETGDTSAM